MLIDTHAHIYDEQYGDGGAAIIKDMEKDGLAAIVTVGCDERSTDECVALASANEKIFASVGVHPYYPEEADDRLLEKFAELAKNKKVVAVGEFGLDYHHEVFDREAQIRAMNAQYELARSLKLPMIFHVREAAGDFADFLRTRSFPDGGVMHCFSGSVETSDICLKKGLMIAFGGKLTYSNSRNLHAVAAHVPEDMIVVETDAPYLTPAKFLGELNYPRHVAQVRDKIAELRGVDPERVEEFTVANALRLFPRLKTA